jgi:hypothetical protein
MFFFFSNFVMLLNWWSLAKIGDIQNMKVENLKHFLCSQQNNDDVSLCKINAMDFEWLALFQ